MKLGDEYRLFTEADVKAFAPSKPGVYALYQFGDSVEKTRPEIVWRVDVAGDIQQMLLHHLMIRDEPEATRFSFEVCEEPENRLEELRRDTSLSHALPVRVEMHPQ